MNFTLKHFSCGKKKSEESFDIQEIDNKKYSIIAVVNKTAEKSLILEEF